MDTEKPSQDDLKGKLKIMNIVFYSIFIIWLVFIGAIIYRLILNQETTGIFIATIPIVAILIVLSQLKSKIKKEIK